MAGIDGRSIIITGGASGIGEAASRLGGNFRCGCLSLSRPGPSAAPGAILRRVLRIFARLPQASSAPAPSAPNTSTSPQEALWLTRDRMLAASIASSTGSPSLLFRRRNGLATLTEVIQNGQDLRDTAA
jgi:hypothetical protein